MLIRAEQKYIKMSPTKLRFIAESVRRFKSPAQAIAMLEHVNKAGALPLVKVLKQAVANAGTNADLAPEALEIKVLAVNEGPTFKRGNPVSRGRFHAIHKKTSHIRVILGSKSKVAAGQSRKPKGVKKSKVSLKKGEEKDGSKS